MTSGIGKGQAFAPNSATFVFASIFATEWMGTPVPVFGNIGIVFGLLQFVTTFAITWLYLRQARTRLDPIAQQIREQLEGGAR